MGVYPMIEYDINKLPQGDEYDPPERIVCAANIYGSQIIAGVRHGCDVMCDALDGFLAIKEFEKLSLELMSQMKNSEIYHEIDGIIISRVFKDFSYDKECQGFLTSKYRFVTRTEAWRIALRQRQIVRRCGGDTINGGTLYSENLY